MTTRIPDSLERLTPADLIGVVRDLIGEVGGRMTHEGFASIAPNLGFCDLVRGQLRRRLPTAVVRLVPPSHAGRSGGATIDRG